MEGLNNLKLNAELLSMLYGRSIVEAGNQKLPENKLTKTVIFFKDSTRPALADRQHKFLEQILKACKQDIREVDIINLADNTIVLENVISTLSPDYILSFGTGTGTELFTMGNTKGTQYLNAPDLSELMQETAASRQMKGKLWSELKAMFNL
jgi:hypothetical protein